MAKMPTVLHERRPGKDNPEYGWEPGSMRTLPHMPLYYFSARDNCWSRILMMEDGNYLRVVLTPSNPTVESEWEALREERIQWQGRDTLGAAVNAAPKNRVTREIPAEVVRHMHYHLGSPVAERLLTGDIWAEVATVWPEGYERTYDVSDWLARNGYNSGIALAKLVKNPPTWAEIGAAKEKQRNAEREERIAAAVANAPQPAEPLSEEELALGTSLEQHDWSYQYSDCGDTWRRGNAHREELERRLKALPVERRKVVWSAFVHPHNEQYWRCPV